MKINIPNLKRHLPKILLIILIFFVCLSILQWFVILYLINIATEMLKEAMISQAPEDVDRDRLIQTFERVKRRVQQLPFSFITGKINIRKIKLAGDYAIAATSNDGTWDAEEIHILLRYLNASIGYKRETE